jgi:hypothetical protein
MFFLALVQSSAENFPEKILVIWLILCPVPISARQNRGYPATPVFIPAGRFRYPENSGSAANPAR